MSSKLAVCVFLGLIAVVLLPAAAEAQYFYGGNCYGGVGGYWGQSVYVGEHIPYYSLYPPVYYSYPVSRPYGWSPFSYGPFATRAVYSTPTVVASRRVSQAVVIQNKFVDNAPSADATEPKLAARPGPLRIKNPYVNAGDGDSPNAEITVPKKVFPADLASLK